MKLKIKRIAQALGFTAVLVGVPAAQAENQIVYGVQSGTTYLPVAVAIAKGFYQQAGGTGEVKLKTATSDEIQKGLVTEEMAFGGVGSYGAVVQNGQTNGKIRILSGLSRGNTFVYCRADSFKPQYSDGQDRRVADLEELKKHIIGVVGFQAIQTASIRMAGLQYFGSHKFFDSAFVQPKTAEGKLFSHPDYEKRMMASKEDRVAGDVECVATTSPYSDHYGADSRFVKVLGSYDLNPEGKYGSQIGSNPTFVVQAYNADYCRREENVGNCVAMRVSVQRAQEWLGDPANHAEAAKIFLSVPADKPIGKGFTEKAALSSIAQQVKLNSNGNCNAQGVCNMSSATELISVGQYAVLGLIEGVIPRLPIAEHLAPVAQADISLPHGDSARQRREARIIGNAVAKKKSSRPAA